MYAGDQFFLDLWARVACQEVAGKADLEVDVESESVFAEEDVIVGFGLAAKVEIWRDWLAFMENGHRRQP